MTGSPSQTFCVDQLQWNGSDRGIRGDRSSVWQGRFHGPASAVGVLLMAVLLLNGGVAQAQSGKSKKPPKQASPAQLKVLDAKVGKLQDGFLRDAAEIAQELEEVGQLERAKGVYETLYKISPQLPGLETKIKELSDQMLASTEFEFELDVSRGWLATGAMAIKDRNCRIDAKGEYKFAVSTTATATGVPTGDAATELIAGIPLGALIGTIVTNNKPGKPFHIVPGQDFRAPESGSLILKVNVPRGHNCTGKLDLTLGGFLNTTPDR